MKIIKITLHNFRSIREQLLNLTDYSLLIGANNSGKTNIIDALRIFYEKDLKFVPNRDFPKFNVDDQESWIEIEFHLDDDEFLNLKNEYRQSNNILQVRKYFKSTDSNRVKSNQSNIYAYEKESLSDNLFYGAKNISEAKLGDVIYIPEVTKIDEYTKLSGPSAFRNLLEFVVKKVIKNSSAFGSLSTSFEDFNKKFKEEASKDGISLQNLMKDINDEIRDWGTFFGIEINQIKPEEIIKNLVSHYLEDKNLKDQRLDISSFGQGLQRYLIYALIKLSVKYKDIPTKKDKKEFAPHFTLILFEEPEAFLHPAQQEVLNISLKELSSEISQQVLISTHSTHFVSKNIYDMPSILKLAKEGPQTIIYQVDEKTLKDILKENKELKEILGEKIEEKDIELESIRYCLWLDPDRCCASFADSVLICEGLSEKALIDTLIKERKIQFKNSKTYILNSGGKYDIHRYMNLFAKFGIRHSILFDGDNNSEKHRKINEFIQKSKNSFTANHHQFPAEFEDFLGISKESDRYKKPLNVMWHYRNKKISQEKINELTIIVSHLME
jgi:predicted ATP-dependent endonuclease of OLD family